VGWRDRDWAKFTPEEFDAIYGGGSKSPFGSNTGRGRGPDLSSAIAGGRSRRRRRASSGLRSAMRIVLGSIVGFAAIFGAMLATGHVRTPGAGASAAPSIGLDSPLPVPVVKIPVQPHIDTKLITIRWRTRDLTPAANAGRICVTDDKHGRICASYVVGERPADNLTRRIEALGLHVESSG
jgi:hypothetical protein